MSKRIEIGLLALILVAAALLRLLWLDTIPEGWHHDAALMGIMASEVFREAQRPIFFPGYLGQEPLYIYISAFTMWLMGGNLDILPLRITSAAFGIATVGVTYLLGRELYDRRTGLIGCALLALSFWQVMLGRDGYRVITQPLLQGLAIFLLWRAIRSNSLWYYLAAGIALGATIYTYLGARLFPFVLLLFVVWWVLAHGWPSARTRTGLLVLAVVAVLVAAPLLMYFLTHPGSFSARIDQVSVFSRGVEQESVRALGENTAKLLGTFTVHGEVLWRYNIPGRPIFVGAVALLFYAGLLVIIGDVIRKRAAGAIIVAWFVVMAFPSILTYDVGSYTFRTMGLVPALYLVPAVGLIALWDWSKARLTRPGAHITRPAFVAVTAAILLIDGVITYRDYFTVWAHSFGGAYENMVDAVAASRFLDREARPDDEEVFVSSDFYPHVVITHLTPRVYPYVRWFDGNFSLVFSPKAAKDSLYVFQYSALPQQLDSLMPTEAMVERSFFDNGAVKHVAYRLTPAQVQSTVSRIMADPALTKTSKKLGDEVELLAYRLDHRVVQGEDLKVTTIWRILKDAPTREYAIFSHLLDVHGTMWAQFDARSYPTREWRAGDIVVDQHAIKIDDRVDPGKYQVTWGFYDAATLKRLAMKDGATAQEEVKLSFVKVAGREQAISAATPPMTRRLGDAVALEGFDLERRSGVLASSTLKVDLYWLARSVPADDYTVFVQLVNPEGRLVAQSDAQPLKGRFPTSYWEPGDRVVDRHELEIGKLLPPGKYNLIAGMYLLSTGERLAAEGGRDYIPLSTVDID